MTVSATAPNVKPPRDNLVRLADFKVELRAKEGSETPILNGHFTRFNEWTEIDSFWEGRFMERIAPGSFKKTFKEQKDDIRCLFQHGRDPQIGNKPLGPIREMREDGDTGPYYEVDLLDAAYVREDILPGLREGLYGASFRMQVIREEINEKPGRSDHNPDGIPERTIKEVRCFEFGPVTFPAYRNATAGVRSRSLTDWWLVERATPAMLEDLLFKQVETNPERLRDLLERYDAKVAEAAERGDDDQGGDDDVAADSTDTDKSGADDEARAGDDTTSDDGKNSSDAGDSSTSSSKPSSTKKLYYNGRSKPQWEL